MKVKFLILIYISIVSCLVYLLNREERANNVVSLRASIVSEDNVTLAYSQKMYHLSLLSGAFDKKEFSAIMDEISTIVPVKKKCRSTSYFKEIKKQEYRIVVYGISIKQIEKIRTILENIIAQKNSIKHQQYYAFTLSGENRIYPHGDIFTPVIGYTHKWNDAKNYTHVKGVKGIEKYYDSKLLREDVVVSINFTLQQRLEKELDNLKRKLGVEEVISVVLDTESFCIKALASTNRYRPRKIKRDDFSKLNIGAMEYMFELENFNTPIKRAILNESSLTLDEGYKRFGTYIRSGIELNRGVTSNQNMKVNLLQLVKMYAVFFNKGKISNISIVQPNRASTSKQIISQKNAEEIQKSLPLFFKEMQDKKFQIELKNKTTTGTIYMKSVEVGSSGYLQAYFIVDNRLKEQE